MQKVEKEIVPLSPFGNNLETVLSNSTCSGKFSQKFGYISKFRLIEVKPMCRKQIFM